MGSANGVSREVNVNAAGIIRLEVESGDWRAENEPGQHRVQGSRLSTTKQTYKYTNTVTHTQTGTNICTQLRRVVCFLQHVYFCDYMNF